VTLLVLTFDPNLSSAVVWNWETSSNSIEVSQNDNGGLSEVNAELAVFWKWQILEETLRWTHDTRLDNKEK